VTIDETEMPTALSEETEVDEHVDKSRPPESGRLRLDLGGRLLRWAVVLLVIVGMAAAITFAALAGHASDRARDRTDALATAKSRVPVLLSYDHRTLEADLDRSKNQTTGRFRTDYTKLLEGPVAKAATQKQISTKATLSGAGVVEVAGPRVTVLVFITQTTIAPGAEPSVSASRVEVKMQRVGNGWKVAGLTPR
jgi:Mce-associated membrane protein